MTIEKISDIMKDRITLASSTRFSSKELRKVEALVIDNKEHLMEAWNEYFSS